MQNSVEKSSTLFQKLPEIIIIFLTVYIKMAEKNVMIYFHFASFREIQCEVTDIIYLCQSLCRNYCKMCGDISSGTKRFQYTVCIISYRQSRIVDSSGQAFTVKAHPRCSIVRNRLFSAFIVLG